jgi:hypothetical protein
MSDHPSKEFQEFTSLVDRLLKVPKAALDEKMEHHRASVRARVDPTRPGRKRKDEKHTKLKSLRVKKKRR